MTNNEKRKLRKAYQKFVESKQKEKELDNYMMNAELPEAIYDALDIASGVLHNKRWEAQKAFIELFMDLSDEIFYGGKMSEDRVYAMTESRLGYLDELIASL